MITPNNLLDVQKQLKQSLESGAVLEQEFQSALAKMEPLRQKVHANQSETNSLIASFQTLTNANVTVTVTAKGRRSGRAKGTYVISNESKIAATGKRSYTRAINAGLSEKQAKQAQADAEKNLSAKLGVSK